MQGPRIQIQHSMRVLLKELKKGFRERGILRVLQFRERGILRVLRFRERGILRVLRFRERGIPRVQRVTKGLEIVRHRHPTIRQGDG